MRLRRVAFSTSPASLAIVPTMPAPSLMCLLTSTRLRGSVLACALTIFTVLVADPAAARRGLKAAPAAAEPLDVVVLPFDALRGKEPRAAREALELELELVDNVRVQDHGALMAELDKARDPLAPATIKSVMARRSIEVLVLTPMGYERPIVVGFGADGRPRVIKELPRGAGADQLAATVLTVLRPAFENWRELPAVVAPRSSDDDDVLTTPAPKKRRALDGDDDDVLVDLPQKKTSSRGEPLPAGDVVADDDDDAAERRRRAALDDAEDDNLDGGRRRTIDEVEDGSGRTAVVKDSHTFAISGTFDGSAWTYTFDGDNNLEPDPVNAGFYPGGRLRADLWPVDFFGVDVSVGVSALQFVINSSPTITVAPSRFASLHINAGAAAKVRWLARFSEDGPLRVVGLGGRLGYRFWQGSVETQRVAGTDRILTVVPGFSLHGLTVGPEIYLPIFVFDRRFELELKADALPLTRYAESPDNPGKNSLAFGYHAEALLRLDVINGVFIEAGGSSTGLTINFEGEGDRVTVEDGSTLVPLRGGRALNATVAFSVGLGFMF